MSYTSPYLELPLRSESEVRFSLGRTKLVSRFVTNGGTETSMELWNPDAASIAHHFDAEESEVEFSENDDGEEEVIVCGKVVGLLEYM